MLKNRQLILKVGKLQRNVEKLNFYSKGLMEEFTIAQNLFADGDFNEAMEKMSNFFEIDFHPYGIASPQEHGEALAKI